MLKNQNKKRARQILLETSYVDKESCELNKDIQVRSCPYCGKDEGVILEGNKSRDCLFYNFKKCRHDELIYAYPRPHPRIIEEYFKKEGNLQEPVSNVNTVYKPVPFYLKLYGDEGHYEEFNVCKNGDRVLDIGGGNGELAVHLRQNGCDVEVVEMNPTRVKHLREKMGLKVHGENFLNADLKKSDYDAVVMSQVLMHITDLSDVIRKINHVLKPGGLFISSQINYNAAIGNSMRSAYPGKLTAFFIVSWFTPNSLKKILSFEGFDADTMKIHHRRERFLTYFFPGGYTVNKPCRILFKIMDRIIGKILEIHGQTSYFSIVARKKL